jgi:hypothetical protein
MPTPREPGRLSACEAFYCQNRRQSGQYPDAANATPAAAKTPAPISTLFMLQSPSKACELV